MYDGFTSAAKEDLPRVEMVMDHSQIACLCQDGADQLPDGEGQKWAEVF